MDWNSTASTNWDFTHLEQEAFKSVSTGGGSSGGGDFSVDLKLGQVFNGGNEYGGKWKEGGQGKSSKRVKRGSTGNVPAACLVDGCRSDLSNCRDYHRRHKVCELHSKTPQVYIGGQKQRFCQQCSRFHCLEEFDEGKRSCRKRLDGHNRRRRKPQPESVHGAANIFSNYQGTQLLSFSSLHTHNPAHAAIHSWQETDSLLHNQQLCFLDKHNLCLGSPSYPTGKILQFQTPPGQPLLRNGAISESGEDMTKILNDRFSTAVRESDCALSLLSSPQSQTSRSSISLPHQQPLGLQPTDTVLVSGIGNGCMICPGGPFHLGSIGDEPPPTLPFHWS